LDWVEVSISIASGATELVTGALLNAGITGMVIEDDNEIRKILESPDKYWDYVGDNIFNNTEACIKFYVTDDIFGHESVLLVKQGLDSLMAAAISENFACPLGSLDIKSKKVNDEDWENNWKKYYKPFRVGEKIIIKPVWEELGGLDGLGGAVVFNIEPGHVFGTGLHQTTQLCIMGLEKYISKESKVLDLGCGTGILSIISMLLGAQYAYAVDIDNSAYKTAYHNAKLNNINENYHVLIGDVLEDEGLRGEVIGQGFNIVVANIVSDVIIGLLGFVRGIILNGGTFIASGIITERENDVLNALSEEGFEVINKFEKDGWVSIISKVGKGLA
jgi:ribosomal protein L11 methyltransferase